MRQLNTNHITLSQLSESGRDHNYQNTVIWSEEHLIFAGVFQELPWIKKQEQNEIKRRWHIVVDPSAMPPCSQVEYQVCTT